MTVLKVSSVPKKQIRTEYLFPSQLVIGDIENFETIQQGLIDWIYQYKEKDPGIAKISNKGGWQSVSKEVYSDPGFAKFHDQIIPFITKLVDEFHVGKQAQLTQMWLNINGPHSYNVSHRHPGCELSGCMWVKQTPESGRFVFDDMDYRDAMLRTNTDKEHLMKNKMTPEYVPNYKDGSIALFPASLSHRVEINDTSEDRISIAFNIKLMDEQIG